jgi:hypothetical protein
MFEAKVNVLVNETNTSLEMSAIAGTTTNVVSQGSLIVT